MQLDNMSSKIQN